MWNPESIDMESGIQDSLGLPYMGRFSGNKRAGPLYTLYIVCRNNCSFYLGKIEEPFLQRTSFVPFIIHIVHRGRSFQSLPTILSVNGHHQTSRASRKPAKTMLVATRRFQARFQVNEPNRPETVFSIHYAELSKSKQQNENSLSVTYVKNFLASLCQQELWVCWNSFLQQLAMVVTIRIGVSLQTQIMSTQLGVKSSIWREDILKFRIFSCNQFLFVHFRLGKQPGFQGVCNVSAFNLFLGSRESFRAYFRCYNSLYIFATPTFLAVKLRSPLCFSYIKKNVKISDFEIGGLQFVNWLFGPEKSSGLTRNRPLALDRNRCCHGIQGWLAVKLQQLNTPG